ncbi:unnamed protein product [Thelazia callipaeda]|uniref:Uncharacterized protein n=1 Tax=Thelazia callipaeda TaxID=103827 RepID=A0A0N5D0Q3_THECL|nr:unnamed protein product [Thelazia callipaeda]
MHLNKIQNYFIVFIELSSCQLLIESIESTQKFEMLFMVFLYIRSTDSRDCVDNVKGLCETNNIFGWCFHDKVTGVFNCDSSMYCANQEFLRGKMNSTGCFDRASDDIKCCCNEADMCNYNFLNLKMEATIGYQSCIFNYQTSETTIHFKNCIDPWCFAYLKYVWIFFILNNSLHYILKQFFLLNCCSYSFLKIYNE